MAEREEEKLLLRALRQIPVELQMAVELFYWEHLPVAQIGEILEIPTGTVKSRLYRARDVLRQAIGRMDVPTHLMRTTMDDFERWAAVLRKNIDAGQKKKP